MLANVFPFPFKHTLFSNVSRLFFFFYPQRGPKVWIQITKVFFTIVFSKAENNLDVTPVTNPAWRFPLCLCTCSNTAERLTLIIDNAHVSDFNYEFTRKPDSQFGNSYIFSPLTLSNTSTYSSTVTLKICCALLLSCTGEKYSQWIWKSLLRIRSVCFWNNSPSILLPAPVGVTYWTRRGTLVTWVQRELLGSGLDNNRQSTWSSHWTLTHASFINFMSRLWLKQDDKTWQQCWLCFG